MALAININDLLNKQRIESNRIEFKKGWNPGSIYHSICAFANDFDDLGGGYIIVGVDTDDKTGMAIRPVEGVPMEKIDNILQEMVGYNNKMAPYYLPRTSVEEVDGKQLIVIWCPAGSYRPYSVPVNVTAKGIKEYFYIRSGTSSIEARGKVLVELREVNNIKGHTLFTEYNEAIRLAKIILHHYDHSINTNADSSNMVIPFVLDMSLLYEHYVYGLLHDAYADRVVYQYEGVTGKPDFLYFSDGFKAILDTKYIPKYESCALDNYVVRQLSGYSRDIKILKRLGYADITEESPVPDVPCVIIYPTEGHEVNNPFMAIMLKELCLEHRIKRLSQFYKIAIPLPVVSK